MHGRNRVCGFFTGQRSGNRGCQNASPLKVFGLKKFGIKSDSIVTAEGLTKAIRGPQSKSGCLRCRGLSLKRYAYKRASGLNCGCGARVLPPRADSSVVDCRAHGLITLLTRPRDYLESD